MRMKFSIGTVNGMAYHNSSDRMYYTLTNASLRITGMALSFRIKML